MIKKIICPTDFSKAAENAVAYAAKLAQVTNSQMEIFHLHQNRVLESVFAGTETIKKARYASEALVNVCREVNRAFHIPCTADLGTRESFFEKITTLEEADNELLVMGTNGADDLFQQLFGSNTFYTLKQAKCPVLIIPETVEYATITKIIFAWDYSIASKNFYFRLKDFLELFNAELIFLHVSRNNSMISQDLFGAVKDTLEEALHDSKIKIKFNRIFADDIIHGIDEYVKESKANLLSLIYHNQSEQLFSRNKLIKELSQSAEYPILVLHEISTLQ